MSKTNHQRGFKAEKFPPAHGDRCCGKRGERRDKAGAKKFIHSRHRASTAMALKALEKEVESTTDFDECELDVGRIKFPSNFVKD